MRLIILVVPMLLASIGIGIPSWAEQMGPARTLRKLSQKIRAVDPAESEYKKLASARNVDAFLSKKAGEYLDSAEAAELMAYRLEELFRWEARFFPPELKKAYPEFESSYLPWTDNATVRIFRSILAENRPWNDLLLSREYILSSKTYPKILSDSAFFAKVSGSAAQPDDPLHLLFKSEDLRIAGVLSSPLFRARYYAPQSNMNRRLAQAVFRIFLCEELNPAVPTAANPDEAYRSKLLEVIKRLHGQKTANSALAHYVHDPKSLKLMKLDDHDTLPSCKACHERLDPLARTFGVPGDSVLAAEPFAGAFVKRVNGEKIETPVQGLSELASVLIEQEEYASCQVRHFWNWFVGPEVPRDQKTAEKWEKSFRENRGTRDWISWIVAQPEFRTDRTKLLQSAPRPSIPWEAVQPVFMKCNQCHSVHGVSFSARPWGGDEQSDASWLERIRARVLLPEGSPGAMPPNPIKWDPMDLKTLRSWAKEAP